MDISGKTVVITGGASGIGAALARQMAERGAHVGIADLNGEAARDMASQVNGVGVACDVAREQDILGAIAATEAAFGPVDIFVSNAGLGRPQPDHAASASNEIWNLNWQVHVMAHVYAARALLPAMLERGSGYFVGVASAAGLLNQIGDAAYSATKNAAVSFAESLHISHADQGIGVSVVCPQYVATPLLGLSDEDASSVGSLLTADQVAETMIEGIEAETFRILPHPQVADYVSLRAQEPQKWLNGMRKLKAYAEAQDGGLKLESFYKLV